MRRDAALEIAPQLAFDETRQTTTLLGSRQEGREVVYGPRESRKSAGSNALQHVLDTFFSGAIDEALAAHFARKEEVTPEQLARLQEMIAQTKLQKKQSPKK